MAEQKFHLNTETGDIGPCRASTRPCPLGGSEVHFKSAVEAAQAYEKLQAGEELPKASRKSSWLRLPWGHSREEEEGKARARRISEEFQAELASRKPRSEAKKRWEDILTRRAHNLPYLKAEAGKLAERLKEGMGEEKTSLFGKGRGDFAAVADEVERLSQDFDRSGNYDDFVAGVRRLRHAFSWKKDEAGTTLDGREFYPPNARKLSDALVEHMEKVRELAYYMQEDGLHGMNEELLFPIRVMDNTHEPLREEYDRRLAGLTALEKDYAASLMRRAHQELDYYIEQEHKDGCHHSASVLTISAAPFARALKAFEEEGPESSAFQKAVTGTAPLGGELSESEDERVSRLILLTYPLAEFLAPALGYGNRDSRWRGEELRRKIAGSYVKGLPLAYKYRYNAKGDFCHADGTVIEAGARPAPAVEGKKWAAYSDAVLESGKAVQDPPPLWQPYRSEVRSSVSDR